MANDSAGASSRALRNFLWCANILIVLGFTVLSVLYYRIEYLRDPAQWNKIFEGREDAPAQYRIGVWFVANFLSKLSHLPTRHTIALLDGVFMAIGISAVFYLLGRQRFFLNMSHTLKIATSLAGLCLFLYPIPWLFSFHKGETVGNFACLAVAALVLSGKTKLPAPVAAIALIALSAYLATIRADSAFALNVGILAIALLPGGQTLPLGRLLQVLTGGLGALTVVGVEFYIKHYMFPNAPYPISPFQLVANLTSFYALYCVVVALAPWYFTVWSARRHWARLEAWERAMIVASAVEFVIFFVVAMANEVRLFLPYVMALVPTTAVLLTHELGGERTVS